MGLTILEGPRQSATITDSDVVFRRAIPFLYQINALTLRPLARHPIWSLIVQTIMISLLFSRGRARA